MEFNNKEAWITTVIGIMVMVEISGIKLSEMLSIFFGLIKMCK